MDVDDDAVDLVEVHLAFDRELGHHPGGDVLEFRPRRAVRVVRTGTHEADADGEVRLLVAEVLERAGRRRP